LPTFAYLVILMTMSTPLSLADVKAHLSELVSRVHGQHERVTVTVHGRPSAVLLSVEDLESLEETIAVLSDSNAVATLIASEAELARGESIDEAELTAAVAARGRPAS
jgi:antitoxin YefM